MLGQWSSITGKRWKTAFLAVESMEENSGRKGLSQKRGYGTDQMVNIHSKSFSKFSVSLKAIYYFDIKVHKWFSFEAFFFWRGGKTSAWDQRL